MLSDDMKEIKLVMFPEKEVIVSEIAAFKEEIKKREIEIKMLRRAIEHYQYQCESIYGHEGQEHGHNERDGNWTTPCKICGSSK